MLGILSNMLNVASRGKGPTHDEMYLSHKERQRREQKRWEAHHHWFDRRL